MSKRVLLVDSEKGALDDIAEFLSGSGFEVQTASTGESAVELAMREPFDIFLCNIHLPDVDGCEVCRRLKKKSATGDIPFLLIAGPADHDEWALGLEAGADDFVADTSEKAELVSRIRINLEKAAGRRSVYPAKGLADNITADRVLREKVKKEQPFSYLLIGIKGTRAYREVYGDEKLNDVLDSMSWIISEVIKKQGGRDDLGAYLGEGRFSILTKPGRAETFCRSLIKLFDREVRGFYSSGDLERGGLLTFDRQGGMIDNPIMSLSIGVASNAHRGIGSHWQAAEIARDMLEHSMTFTHSNYKMDRRSG